MNRRGLPPLTDEAHTEVQAYETTNVSLRVLAHRHGFLSHTSICRRRDNEG